MEDSTELEFSNSAVQFGNTNNDFYVLSESEVHKASVCKKESDFFKVFLKIIEVTK